MNHDRSRAARGLLATAAVALALAGCDGFLTETDAVNNPNKPTEATRNQLFVGVQAGQFGTLEASIAQAACMFVQQCAGVGGRFAEQRGRYNFTENDFSPDFTGLYAGGGLTDLREVQRSASADGDSVYLGIARVWEALMVGTAADVWGDVPYREAANPDFPTPQLDPQLQVYDDLQALLDRAIANLRAGPGNGPGINDLVYGGDREAWIEAAHTLKARLYLHTVEARGAGEYARAITAALEGISAPANDFRALHGAPTAERNLWYQFSETSFGQDLVAGRLLAELMVARNDPRLPQYFGPAPGGGYGGAHPDGTQSANGASPLTGTRIDPLFRQPFLTFQENELILAEAYQRTGQDAQALAHLNAARAVVPLPPLAALAGEALFREVVAEKYIALFQNIEAWSDYRRTCFAGLNLVAYRGQGAVSSGEVPGRLFYGQTERNANPNVPSTATQLSEGGVAGGRPGVGGFRNPNDPDSC